MLTSPDVFDGTYRRVEHCLGASCSGALFSPDDKHRYALWRIWDLRPRYALFCGLNPSTADAVKSDPTCTREINWAKRWGFSGYVKVNVDSYRSTDPNSLKSLTYEQATGHLYNDIAISHYARNAAMVVVCWGVHGKLFSRSEHVYSLLRSVGVVPFAFHFERDGKRFAEVAGNEARHTLYLPNSAQLHEYTR